MFQTKHLTIYLHQNQNTTHCKNSIKITTIELQVFYFSKVCITVVSGAYRTFWEAGMQHVCDDINSLLGWKVLFHTRKEIWNLEASIGALLVQDKCESENSRRNNTALPLERVYLMIGIIEFTDKSIRLSQTERFLRLNRVRSNK